jgi:hypothetical protein
MGYQVQESLMPAGLPASQEGSLAALLERALGHSGQWPFHFLLGLGLLTAIIPAESTARGLEA